MESDYQFPRSLSLSNFSKVREPSLSSYLNDGDGRLVVKLAEMTRTRSGLDVHLGLDDEIGVFRADKYFNEGLEDVQKHKESSGFRRFAVEGNKEDSVSGPVRSKISLGTPSIRSESSSRHSQSALLHSFPIQVPGRRSTGEMQRKKSVMSGFISRCSCISKKSLKVDDDHLMSKESTRQGINRADQLLQVRATLAQTPRMKDSQMFYPSVTPSLLDKVIGSSKYQCPNLLKGNTECSRYTTDPFNPPDSSASGYATPTTCYAPSEASIDWSVVTASAADFFVLSDCEEFKPPMPVPITRTNKYTVTDKHKHTNENTSQSLMGCTNHKEVRVSGNMDLQKKKDNINYQQIMHMDQFVAVSRIHAQASTRPPTSSKSR